jgi:hypothetical protein
MGFSFTPTGYSKGDYIDGDEKESIINQNCNQNENCNETTEFSLQLHIAIAILILIDFTLWRYYSCPIKVSHMIVGWQDLAAFAENDPASVRGWSITARKPVLLTYTPHHHMK